MTDATSGDASPPKEGGRSTKLRGVLRWFVALALGALALRSALADPTALRALAGIDAVTIALLWALSLLNNFLISQRMALAVVECGGPRVPAWPWFKLVIVGQFVNLVVPQLGNVYRGLMLKREYGVSYLAYASGLLAFVWLDTLLGVFICGALLGIVRPGLALGGVPALPALVALFLGLLGGPVALARVLPLLAPKDGLLVRVHTLATRLIKSTTASLARPTFVARFVAIGLLVTVVQVLALRLCFDAVGAPMDVATAALLQVVVKVSNQVVVTPGNLGVSELAWGALGKAATGRSLASGVAAALLFRVAFTPLLVVLGLAFGGVGVIARTRAEQRGASQRAP
jgi:uncharacterized membrane protein YbhN (UPF0104 family)